MDDKPINNERASHHPIATVALPRDVTQFIDKLNGYIVSAEDETPIAEATVSLFNGLALLATATSDTEGRFTFSGVLPGQYLIIKCRKPGFVEAVSTVTTFCDNRITMSQAKSITGVVLNKRTRLPVSDTTCFAYLGTGMPEITTQTDVTGKFLFGIPQSVFSVYLTITHPDYESSAQEIQIDFADDGVIGTFMLEEPLFTQLSLLVYSDSDSARPLADVRIQIGLCPLEVASRLGLAPNELSVIDPSDTALTHILFHLLPHCTFDITLNRAPIVTDASGECIVPYLPQDLVDTSLVFVFSQGKNKPSQGRNFGVLPLTRALHPLEANIFIARLEPSLPWKGRVTDCDGQPVAGCRVEISRHTAIRRIPLRPVNEIVGREAKQAERLDMVAEVVETDNEGVFTNSLMRGAQYDVTITHQGIGQAIIRRVTPPPDTSEPLDFQFSNGTTILLSSTQLNASEEFTADLVGDGTNLLLQLRSAGTLLSCMRPGEWGVFGLNDKWFVRQDINIPSDSPFVFITLDIQRPQFLYCRFLLSGNVESAIINKAIFYLQPELFENRPGQWMLASAPDNQGELLFYPVLPGRYFVRGTSRFPIRLAQDNNEAEQTGHPVLYDITNDGDTFECVVEGSQ